MLMFGKTSKSILTFQLEGRLSSYLSDIDNCENFSSDNLTKLNKTMKMTECIHSLLDHTRINCLNDNKEFIENNNLIVDINRENQLLYTFKWTQLNHTKTISGIAEIKFLIHNIDDIKISNFKTDNIENLTKLIIDFMTLTFVKTDNRIEKSMLIIKTKNFDTNNDNFTSTLKTELESNCNSFQTTPTFLYLKHKDNVGFYQKHYSNYADK
jgi:hypothetical protein